MAVKESELAAELRVHRTLPLATPHPSCVHPGLLRASRRPKEGGGGCVREGARRSRGACGEVEV